MIDEKPRILIVDDSPQDIHMLLGELKDDYRINAATSADQALTMLQGDMHPNLILMDVNMPGTNGYHACRSIKSTPNLNEIDVIFLSGNDSNEDIIEGLDAGALDYIVKPYDMELLQSKIKNAISSHDKRIALREEAKQANKLAHTIMSESGSLGTIISFLRESFTTETAEELIHILIDTLRMYNLSAVVSFRAKNIRESESTTGDISMLELEIMDRMHGLGQPFVEHGDRLFVIQQNTVVFIKNMPKDEDKRGSLKDHLMILLEGSNARLEQFVRNAEEGGRKVKKVGEVILRAKNTLDEIHDEQDAHKKKAVAILDDMVAQVEASFFTMALTDKQESELLEILSVAVDRSLSHMEKGLEIDEKLKQTVSELSHIVQETVYLNRAHSDGFE